MDFLISDWFKGSFKPSPLSEGAELPVWTGPAGIPSAGRPESTPPPCEPAAPPPAGGVAPPPGSPSAAASSPALPASCPFAGPPGLVAPPQHAGTPHPAASSQTPRVGRQTKTSNIMRDAHVDKISQTNFLRK